MAAALLVSPKQANAMPASPTPTFLSAAQRVTAWSRPLVRSSNWWFIVFLFGFGGGLSGRWGRRVGTLSTVLCQEAAIPAHAPLAATLTVLPAAIGARRPAGFWTGGLGFVRKPKAGQRHAGET